MQKSTPETSSHIPPGPLVKLADQWEAEAKRKMASARLHNDIAAQRPTTEALIQHGAICYFACAQELRKALASNSQPTR
ncbi:hypothetical protein PITCH_A1970005 [uncultured Desulfobacterium sp.]|uniref:Uncharacterized protein n=1 Tax=uncultured Desulfobacterium sp. TaxID=201089 RepID=A0A445MWC9_9BACT|nr:hypothetical protein PITCH_A1970005 [uncultured Desulfobacterium sp.]